MKSIKAILDRARKTYGNKNQILVCIEELNELACVLAKYPRYEDEEVARRELHDKVLDEVADVNIILQHVNSIMDFNELDVNERIALKVERLERWLNKSNSMQQTIDDREIRDCSTCCNRGKKEAGCTTCLATEAVEGIKPYYKKKG